MLKSSLHSKAAFTLLEIMLVVMIIALLAGSVIFMMGDQLEDARKSRAQAEIKSIGVYLMMYNAQNGFYPSTEQGLKALITKPDTEPRPRSWKQHMKEVPVDGWSSPYNYESPGKRNPESYDLYSSGKDRIAGTADDVGNWKADET